MPVITKTRLAIAMETEFVERDVPVVHLELLWPIFEIDLIVIVVFELRGQKLIEEEKSRRNVLRYDSGRNCPFERHFERGVEVSASCNNR